MVQFNFSERTIKAKVVYYGPAQSGKTTNLEQVHVLTDPAGANRLVSLNTAQDRTLFFDLLPFSLGTVSGYDFQVQLYTVPGQVQYNATRRVVLAGADAVVFIADSRRAFLKENVAAYENMKVNLLANRLVPERVPLVFQYNKQDLPDLMPLAEIDAALNAWARPTFAAVAAAGRGVMETFLAAVQDMLRAIAQKYNLKDKGLDPDAVPELVPQPSPPSGPRGAKRGDAPPLPSAARDVSQRRCPPGRRPAHPVVWTGLRELLHRALAPPWSGRALALVRERTWPGAILATRAFAHYKDVAEKRAVAIRPSRGGPNCGDRQRWDGHAPPPPPPLLRPRPPRPPAPPRPHRPRTAPAGRALVRDAVARVQRVLDGRALRHSSDRPRRQPPAAG